MILTINQNTVILNPITKEGKALINSSNSPIMGTNRKGLIDLWNAFMLENASFSQNDIPLCPSTAKALPNKLVSFDDAKTIHRKELRSGNNSYRVDAFIHFFIDDQKFDGKQNSIWLYPEKALDIICHFAGIIAPDFSTYADFPEPLKMWNFFRMNTFGYWIGVLGIPVISNLRWGTEETWRYCFDGNPRNSILAIGTVASGARLLKNRPLFEKGLFKSVEVLHPHTIIVYGSAAFDCFDILREQGIKIVSFPSKTSEAFAGRKSNE